MKGFTLLGFQCIRKEEEEAPVQEGETKWRGREKRWRLCLGIRCTGSPHIFTGSTV